MARKATSAPPNVGATQTIAKKPQASPEHIVQSAKQERNEVVKPIPEPVSTNNEPKEVFRVKESLSPHMYVTVRNGFNGKLVYVSKRNGERLVWDSFGAEQEMELQELKNAKNASRAFFENNWFMIDDPEVIAYLGVERYYRTALRFDDFDDLFTKSPDEISERIALLSNGQRASVAYRARQLIAEGQIDSMRVINALEKSLSTELVER